MDNRRCFRFKMELPAWFQNTRYQKDLSLAMTINVSANGICLITREPLEVDQEILMQVKIPPEDRVIIRTQVVWVKEMPGTIVREYQVGLRVVEPMQFEETKFVKFCAQKMLEFWRHQNHSA